MTTGKRKRHESIQPLSREHHAALIQAKSLREAPPDEAALRERVEGFLAFWQAEGNDHFRVEEEVLLPWYARYGEVERPEIVRILTEHVLIRRVAAEMAEALEAGSIDPSAVHALGERLKAHVRFEEDVAFNLIEDVMPDEALHRMAEHLN